MARGCSVDRSPQEPRQPDQGGRLHQGWRKLGCLTYDQG